MKFIHKVIVILLLVFSDGCSDDDKPVISEKDLGIVTGQDFRECSCCGGWFIDIGEETFRFLEVPKNSIDLSNETFPLTVELEWSLDSTGCLGDEIIIHSISKH